MNRTVSGDREGEFTYIDPRDCSIIDYVIVNERCIDIVKKFRLEESGLICPCHWISAIKKQGEEEEKERRFKGKREE